MRWLFASCFVLLVRAGACDDLGLSTDYLILGDKGGVWAAPAQVVCGPKVESMQWSPDGKHLCIRQNYVDGASSGWKAVLDLSASTPPPVYQNCLVYSVKTGKLRTLYSGDMTTGGIVTASWMTGTDTLCVLTQARSTDPSDSHSTYELLRYDASAGALSKTTGISSESGYFELLRTAGAFSVIWNSTSSWIVPPRGNIVPVVLPSEAKRATYAGTNPKTGQFVWITAYGTLDKGDYYSVNSRTGVATPCDPIAHPDLVSGPDDSEEPHLSMVIQYAPTEYKLNGTVARSNAIMLAASDKTLKSRPVVLAKDAESDSAKLSPTGDAVAYISNGGVFVSTLVKLTAADIAACDARKTQELRHVILTNAKEIAVGLIMYAHDYDGVLPANTDTTNSQLMSYVKQKDVFKDFVYTYTGGAYKDISAPQDTELGYVKGPGGRAVMYADGHCKWIKD